MPNVTIGNNVVIGAGSLVNKSVANNVVVAGVPAKIIKSIEEYKAKSIKDGIQINNGNRKETILQHLNDTNSK